MKRTTTSTALVFAALLAASRADALPAPGREPWTPLALPTVDRETRYEPVVAGGEPVLRAIADCSASAVYLPLDGVDLRETPVLRWRWRVPQGIENPDERTRRGDDFAARVYVTFRFDPELASFTERMKHRVARSMFGDWVWGRALVYVWSSSEPAGASWKNPRAGGSHIVSLGHGRLSGWRTERVDVAADFERLFGDRRPPLQAVAVMSDTDQTCSHAMAEFAGFRFEPGPLSPELRRRPTKPVPQLHATPGKEPPALRAGPSEVPERP